LLQPGTCDKWPTYRSIKLLKAMQIVKVHLDYLDGQPATEAQLDLADGTSIKVSVMIYFARYTPVAGDFIICYEGGEEIICSKLDFETGYARA